MIKMFNMDCMEYMRTVPDKYFDLAIVDPPYGIGVNISMGRRKGQSHSGHHKYAGEDKAPPSKIILQSLSAFQKSILFGGLIILLIISRLVQTSLAGLCGIKSSAVRLALRSLSWRGQI